MIERQGGAVAPSSARVASAIQSPLQRRVFSHQSRPMRPGHNTVGSRSGKRRPAMPSSGSIWEGGGDRSKGGGGGGYRVPADSERLGGSLGDERKGEGVVTMEMIIHQCGRSLIEPSAVSSPMDFLTSEAEYRRVWQVFKKWLCSAVSAKLRAVLPRFFSLSYRVFNLGICIPTLELDARFLKRYGITQEQSLSSKSSLSPRAPQQVSFSRETLAKGTGMPPARAAYALEAILCTIGKEAGMGRTLLVDCGVGVLATRGRVMKFTFVQGADSLEVVHRQPPPGLLSPRAAGDKALTQRGGIHGFGDCYIPYTSRGNKELASARARETTSLLRALRDTADDPYLPPDGVEGEEGMIDDGVVQTMRTWNPGVRSTVAAVAPQRAEQVTTTPISERIMSGRRSPLRSRKDRGARRLSSPATIYKPPPPPLIDVYARLQGSIITPPHCGKRGSAASGIESRALVSAKKTPHGREATGVERLGSHYSPAAQALLLDSCRGCISWREKRTEGVIGGGGGGVVAYPEVDTRGCGRQARGGDWVDLGWRRSGGAGVTRREEAMCLVNPPGVVERLTAVTEDGQIMANNDTPPNPEPPEGAQGEEDAVVPVKIEGVEGGRSGGENNQSSPERHGGKQYLRAAPSAETFPEWAAKQRRSLPASPAYALPMGGLLATEARPPSSPMPPGVHGRRLSQFLTRQLRSAPAPAPPNIPSLGLQSYCGARIRDATPEGGLDGDDWPRGAGAAEAGESLRRFEAGFERYHYYLQCDTALAESVTVLQPLWKAGIVQNVLSGLNSGGHLNAVRDHASDVEWFDQTSDEGSEDGATGSVGNVPLPGKGKMEKQADHISRTKRDAPTCSHGAGRPATEDLSEDEADEGGDHFDADNAPGPSRLTGAHESERLEIPKATGVSGANPTGRGEGGGHGSTTGGVQADKRVDTPSLNTGRAGVVAGHGGKLRAASRLERVEVPEGLQEGVQSCLDEACDAFRMSIRRAVLNYVLLDAKQRNRLGIPAVPPGLGNEGWGWGKGRGFRQSPPQWRRRFVRSREALKVGQVAGSPALLAAQALLVECRDIRLLRLPRSAAAVWSSSWFPMTAEEFRSSQLRHLSKAVGRVRRLLYPGLSEALTSRLWGNAGASTPRHDGHVRRYLLAVNVMVASVLRVVVETALADLLAFFEIYSSAWKGGSSQGAGESGTGATSEPGSESKIPLKENLCCPPAFKVFLEETSSEKSASRPELTCQHSLENLTTAVADVVREVVLCFRSVPRVAYYCEDRTERAQHTGHVEGGQEGGEGGGGGGDGGDEARGKKGFADQAPPAENSRDAVRQLSCYSESGSDSDGGTSDSEKEMSSVPTAEMAFVFGGKAGSIAGNTWRGNVEGADLLLLSVLPPYEPVVKTTVKAIFSCLRVGSLTASRAYQAYRPFKFLLSEARLAKARPEDVSEKDLPQIAESLERYKATAALLRTADDAAPVEISGTLVVVDCEETSQKLLTVAGELRKGTLHWVHSTLGRIASDVTKQSRTAILRLGKRPRSTTEMAEAIEYLRTTRVTEQMGLEKRQMWMGDLLDFAFKHGGLNQDTIVAIAGVHRGMVELATATEKAEKAIAEGQAQLQKGIEKARRRVEDDVEVVQVRIASFVDTSGRPRDMVDKVAGIVNELEGLKAQAVDIAEEEFKVDGFSSGSLAAMVDKALVSFQPYADVWILVGSVGPFISSALRSPVTTLDPEAIATEHDHIKEKLEGLHQLLVSKFHASPARAAQEALRQLAAIEKDIPVMKALSNPRLKDTHWVKVSALAGVTISAEHPTTLQQLNELDVFTEAKVEAILRLSDEANAEHTLIQATAAADMFVREEAVLPVTLDMRKASEHDDGDTKEEATLAYSKVDAERLQGLLDEVERWRQVLAEAKLTDEAKVVAAAEGKPDGGLPGRIEMIEKHLTALERASQTILKCSTLASEIEAEVDDHSESDEDHEDELKAVKRWQALLEERSGQSLKDLAEVADEALVYLTEAS